MVISSVIAGITANNSKNKRYGVSIIAVITVATLLGNWPKSNRKRQNECQNECVNHAFYDINQNLFNFFSCGLLIKIFIIHFISSRYLYLFVVL